MIGRLHHLNDDRLVECYFEAVAGEAVPPPEIEHLTDCASCRDRSIGSRPTAKLSPGCSASARNRSALAPTAQIG